MNLINEYQNYMKIKTDRIQHLLPIGTENNT